MEKWGLSRAAATTVITLAGVVVFVLISLLVIPPLTRQTVALFETAPSLFKDLQSFLTSRFPSLLDETSALNQTLTAVGQTIRDRGSELLNSVLTSAAGLLNILTLFVITPVVAVYLLLDWDRMVAQVDDMLPRDHAPVIRELATGMNITLAAFIRGMGSVCLILGTYYAVALMIVGLQFGLVVGFVAGMVTFIPYVGAIIGGALAIGLALFQFWGDWLSIGAIGAIFVLGQMIEGNVLTPRLVGSSVGLHPVWLLLALSVFGSMFGFVGMLVAVPLAAMLGVLVRFAADKYRDSLLYKGLGEVCDEAEDG